MALSLDKIKQNIKNQQARSSGSGFSGPQARYDHWNIKDDEVASIRFLPDGDETNQDSFWSNRFVFKWKFPGVKGEIDQSEVTVEVPCIRMYDESANDPVLAMLRPMYKSEELQDVYGGKDALEKHLNTFWMKKSYIFQGFVRKNPLAGTEEAPENPIRRFNISPQIYKTMNSVFTDPDFKILPTDYDNGLDFNIKKTAQGTYSNYTSSSWSVAGPTPLTQVERDAIEEYGLFNLSDFRPKKPGEIEQKVIVELFEASFQGEQYDMERWGAYYKPWGRKNDDTPAAKPAEQHTSDSAPTADPVREEATPAETPATSSEERAADILARLKMS